VTAFRLGPLEVQELIASGGMSDVWKGVHVVQDVPIALKVIRAEFARDSRFRQAFRREVRAVAQLDHPGIITLYDIGEVSTEVRDASDGALQLGSPYLVMEFLEQGSLESQALPLAWARALEILRAILDGLAHAHARGITHRDLKPGNVLLADERSGSPVRLTDFGLAFSLYERRATEDPGTAAGTPAYMAPEQFLGEWRDFGPWTDLYALGCMAYELATGNLPFQQRDPLPLAAAHLLEEPPDLVCPPDYPAAFGAWVRKLLAKGTGERYGRCAEATAELEVVASPSARSLMVTTLAAPEAPRRPFKLVGAGLKLFGLRTVSMVDREPERELMWKIFDRVSGEGTPGAIVLEGPAGTGKSRLAQWFCERTDELGVADCLRTKYDPEQDWESGLSRMLAAAWSCLGMSATALEDRITTLLSQAGIESRAVRKAVVELLAPGSLGDGFIPGTFHEFRSQAERFDLLGDVLRRMYRERPLVIWLDDVHWGTEALLFIRRVVARSSSTPVRMMAVLTARDDLLAVAPDASRALDDLCREPNVERLRVAPLSAADSRLLVSNLLYLQGDLAERVATRSAGNPLYAGQLVGDWVTRGILAPGAGGFILARQDEPEVPDDVHAVWVQRLERVLDESGDGIPGSTDGAARVAMQVSLELAAVLGGRVRMEEWTAVCALADVADPTPALEALLASRMARVDPDMSRRDVGGWSYSHSMLRESIERLARDGGRWISHHTMCADMMEQRRRVPHWGDSERIGRHRFEARQFEAAARPLLRAARERMRLEEYSAAHRLVALYERALDALSAPDRDPRRVEGLLMRADINCTRRELDEAEGVARHVASLVTSPDTDGFRGAALGILARVHRETGRLHTAVDEFGEAQRILRSTGPKQALASCLSEQADALLELGQLDNAGSALNEAQAIYEDIGQLIPWTENQLRLARIALRQGHTELAATLSRRVRGFAEREALNRIEAAAWSTLGEIEMATKQPAEAEASLDRSIELYQQLGLARQALYPRSLRMLIWLESGGAERAKEELDRLRKSPDADGARTAELMIECVALAAGVDGPAADFEAYVAQAAARLTEVEALGPNVTRCLQLAVERANDSGLPDRATLIKRLGANFDAEQPTGAIDGTDS
jgi:tetratricopeptide (TPR) repeat protein